MLKKSPKYNQLRAVNQGNVAVLEGILFYGGAEDVNASQQGANNTYHRELCIVRFAQCAID